MNGEKKDAEDIQDEEMASCSPYYGGWRRFCLVCESFFFFC